LKRYLIHSIAWILGLAVLVALLADRSAMPSEEQLQVLTAPLLEVQPARRSKPALLDLRIDMGDPLKRVGLLTINNGLEGRLKTGTVLTVHWANWKGNAVVWSVADEHGSLRPLNETKELIERSHARQARVSYLVIVLLGCLMAVRTSLE
jgi:hypothetical protein